MAHIQGQLKEHKDRSINCNFLNIINLMNVSYFSFASDYSRSASGAEYSNIRNKCLAGRWPLGPVGHLKAKCDFQIAEPDMNLRHPRLDYDPGVLNPFPHCLHIIVDRKGASINDTIVQTLSPITNLSNDGSIHIYQRCVRFLFSIKKYLIFCYFLSLQYHVLEDGAAITEDNT